eukprot:9522104-Alexandrium_andersonii.AAC.1
MTSPSHGVGDPALWPRRRGRPGASVTHRAARGRGGARPLQVEKEAEEAEEAEQADKVEETE